MDRKGPRIDENEATLNSSTSSVHQREEYRTLPRNTQPIIHRAKLSFLCERLAITREGRKHAQRQRGRGGKEEKKKKRRRERGEEEEEERTVRAVFPGDGRFVRRAVHSRDSSH